MKFYNAFRTFAGLRGHVFFDPDGEGSGSATFDGSANVTYDKMCARLLSNAAYKCKAYKTNDTPRMVATALNPQPDTAAVMVCLEGQDGMAYVVELLSGASDNVGKDAKLWSIAEEVTYCISSGHLSEGTKIKFKK